MSHCGKTWAAFAFFLALSFGLLTQRWMGFEQGSQFVVATSSPLYVEVARSAPVYPTSAPYYIAERALPHFGVGIAAKTLGISIEAAYLGTTTLLIFLILFAVYFALTGIGISAPITALLLSSILLNPYAFRYYLLALPMFTDLIFVLGLAVIVLGLFRDRFWLVMTGLLVAVLGRNTVLLILPGTLLGIHAFMNPRFRPMKIGSALVVTVLAVRLLEVYALTLGKPEWSEAGLLFSMASWISSPDFSLSILAQHVLRSFLPILIPLAFLFGTTSLEATGKKFKTQRVLALVLIVVGILVAALLPNPAIQQNSQGRFSAYAIVVMTLLIGWIWKGTAVETSDASEKGSEIKIRQGLWLVLGVTLGAASLHHMYTVVGPINVADFGMFHVAACEMLAIVSWYLFRSLGRGQVKA